MQEIHVKLNPELTLQSSIQQKEDCFPHQVGLKFDEETSEVLHLEKSFVWCWRRMEKTSWTNYMRNEDVLHSQGGEEYPKYNKKKEG
jgi:hypothetical protein